MKVNYINILLFALPLNILVHNQRNHKSTTPHHTPKITTTRLLCECELYAPANYDNDTEMKKVMENFNKQTQQRFHEYDDRMVEKRKRCKDKCDKEIQKIILKDKLEKELMDKFSVLETDIQSDAIPTCVCEKSIADKVEKGCLRCAQNLGGIVAPSTGVLGEIAAFAVKAWKDAAIISAKEAAIDKGLALGKIAGDIEGAAEVIRLIKQTLGIEKLGVTPLQSLFNAENYMDATVISGSIQAEYTASECGFSILFRHGTKKPICTLMEQKMFAASQVQRSGLSPTEFIQTTAETIVSEAKGAASVKAAQVASAKTPALEAKNLAAVEATTTPYYTPIIVSIVAIMVIILIMVIIYLILRYRRKKKMKKKVQYIKLLEE
ncbi:rifin PIR protein, putative [Plasmodium reichenowi]|uniref:Rifin PIR protein, putative n=1 Tax=Plasmodium reichenowi TaxID=5854 RepID=A0A2P9DSB6_PLARE|nr:rifin PIR protein, putative [Plasmodium reichenowi]